MVRWVGLVCPVDVCCKMGLIPCASHCYAAGRWWDGRRRHLRHMYLLQPCFEAGAAGSWVRALGRHDTSDQQTCLRIVPSHSFPTLVQEKSPGGSSQGHRPDLFLPLLRSCKGPLEHQHGILSKVHDLCACGSPREAGTATAETYVLCGVLGSAVFRRYTMALQVLS